MTTVRIIERMRAKPNFFYNLAEWAIPPEDPKEIETTSIRKGSIKRFKRLRGHQVLVATVLRDAKL